MRTGHQSCGVPVREENRRGGREQAQEGGAGLSSLLTGHPPGTNLPPQLPRASCPSASRLRLVPKARAWPTPTPGSSQRLLLPCPLARGTSPDPGIYRTCSGQPVTTPGSSCVQGLRAAQLPGERAGTSDMLFNRQVSWGLCSVVSGRFKYQSPGLVWTTRSRSGVCGTRHLRGT